MRILGLVIALLLTLPLSAAAQTTSHSRSRLEPSLSGSYDYPRAKADSGQAAAINPDPYLQRYYSHSEGWTYYNLPPDSSRIF
jgi:hypothetical protein